ncbi:iron ABC transporter ATP-binding protein [Candidatus Rickettsiella isopodorum]|jgi:putative hydroxymethylpyrimidine transport system ATP-binding protein|uniref:Iron ABC transporter ATP-binding protein n=1 Tax=Candidatus Rickettsiella isopodorum TaxID=1225476 RepID=A0A1J8P383_9COXI|nr:ABC transporter ATP-binding protein [Candidatus Rickettsiella isopodorum]OIZ94196.1 iron ABC transporter ATP-binding protein [Candidatus Rickettsiella isopodorum]
MLKSPAVLVSNASLRYQDKVLFNRLNFHLAAGQTTCLLGSSGIGKSRFLQLIAGLNTPSAHITTCDQKGLLGRLAYMSQTNTLLPWLNILNNVVLGHRLRRSNKPYDQARKLLKQLGLGDISNKYPAQLSGGMQQRVALARVLLENRPIVLMDEPFSALDAITRYQLQELTAQALKDRTVLLVTHDPLEALRLGHHIAIMSGQPAKIDYIHCKFNDSPPRSLNKPELLQWQAKLLYRLQELQ